MPALEMIALFLVQFVQTLPPVWQASFAGIRFVVVRSGASINLEYTMIRYISCEGSHTFGFAASARNARSITTMSTKWVVTSLVVLISLLHRNGHAVAAIGVSLLTALFGKIMKASFAVGRPAGAR